MKNFDYEQFANIEQQTEILNILIKAYRLQSYSNYRGGQKDYPDTPISQSIRTVIMQLKAIADD